MKRLVAIFALIALVMSALGLGILSVYAQDSDPMDEEMPGYVDNVVAVPGDGSVILTWDTSTDNVGVTGYKVYYGDDTVSQVGDTYDNALEVGDVLEYIVTGLENDTAYYFAVTALDAAGNESLDYSLEATATPVQPEIADNGEPPSVVSADIVSCTAVDVTFSEAVVFPDENPGLAFTIENLDSLQFLGVQSVTHDDLNDKVLHLTTLAMAEGSQYLMTVGVRIEDLFGNPIVSGTSDTAIFSGMACPEVPDVPVADDDDDDNNNDGVIADDIDAPRLEEVEFINSSEIVLVFDEEVVLPDFGEEEDADTDAGGDLADEEDLDTEEEEPSDPALEFFSIFDGDNNRIDILSVDYADEDNMVLSLITSEHEEGVEYFVSVSGLADTSGNLTTGDFRSSASYTTPVSDPVDVEDEDFIAPEDVNNFAAGVMNLLVNLNWESSLNTAGDLVDQYLYVSRDGGASFERQAMLGANATSYDFSGGVEGENYVFKVTTVDENGNESEGLMTTATLPVTGAGVGLLALASLLGGSRLARRRRE